MDWERINAWTTTLYTLIHSLRLAKAVDFGNLFNVGKSIQEAATWIPTVASYNSVLISEPFENRAVTFRRDPNIHFEAIASQIISMLVQDLVVIFEHIMNQILVTRGERAGIFPQSKEKKLSTHLDPKYDWARQGCLELIAARNVLTHADDRWNKRTVDIVSGFINPPPKVGDRLIIGFPMLFRYRRAMRTVLNEVML